MLTEKVIALLTDLEQHIQAGCLSAIPPQVGDDNFTEIHNCLRKAVSHCRITVPLVSALFSMCLHDINRSKGAPVDFRYKPKSPSVEDVKNELILPQPEEGITIYVIINDFYVQILNHLEDLETLFLVHL